MPDDYNHPEDDNARFRPPEIRPDIHKEDTEELEIIDPYEQETENFRSDDVPDHHNDNAPETKPETDDLTKTLAEGEVVSIHPIQLLDDDNDDDHDSDIPFHLPKSSELEPDAGYPQTTVPHSSSSPTLYGSGGLDPNPDMMANRTLQGRTVPAAHQPQPAATPPPQDKQQYQQPAYRQQPIPPVPQPSPQRPLPKRRKRRRNIGCIAIFIGLFLTFCGGLTLVTAVGGAFAYARVGELLNERIDEVDRYAAFQSTFLYDRDGRELYEVFNEGRRTNVSIDQMPQDLINATIAIEDDSFFRNIGIDVAATTVAFLQFVGASPDENTPGGSTITQQLVRNVLFDPEYRAERSAQRKAEEILLAIALTGRKSKQEILELYLNEIYYGNLAYGAQAAAQVFFNKDVNDLTLGEAAMLAGLPQAPAELDPLNPDPGIQGAVNARWRQVLNEMVEENFITPAQRDEALAQGLAFNPQDVPLEAPHFTVYARGQFEALMLDLGYTVEEIAQGGFHVYTTVDLEINNTVQQIAAEQVASLGANNVSNAAVLVLKPLTGEILSMVGSIDYNNDAIDGRVNVTTAFRQPGSTMKPFTYAGAIERGFSPGDVIWDTRISIPQPGQPDYVPRNYDGAFHGPMRMRFALANSYNIPAVQTLRYIGVDYLLQLMARFGVDSLGLDSSRYGVSLTLGGGDISPLELTRAYTVFANQGVLVDTSAILCVVDNDDQIIYEFENGCEGRGQLNENSVVRVGLGKQVLDPRIAYIIRDMLADEATRQTEMGANSPLNTPNIRSSVKTGTTNDVKDNWTVGFTSNVAVGVWVGNNDGDPMVDSSGLTGAAPIWNRVITMIYQNEGYLREFAVDNQLQNDNPSPPNGMNLVRLCNIRNLTDPATNCNGGEIVEWLLDSPAGIPDDAGNLNYPGGPFRQVQSYETSYAEEIQPGLYRAIVKPIAPEIAAAIQFPVQPGERQPPPPKYCRVPPQIAPSVPDVREQWFIAPPFTGVSQSDVVEAEEYANARGLAFLPTITCDENLLNAPSFGGTPGITAFISSPPSGATVTSGTPIIGTAQFGAGQAQFWKLEILGGDFINWTTIADIRTDTIVNGQLGTIPPLKPGSYQLQLVVIGNDSNHAQPPFNISFTVQ